MLKFHEAQLDNGLRIIAESSDTARSTAFGFFVELEKIFVEGLVHIRNLGDDYYQFDEQKHQLEGHHTKKKFHIGDRVKVRVAHVDLQKLFIDFTLLTKLESFLDE